MSTAPRSLVVSYHSIASGLPPLHVDAGLFERHVEALVDADVTALTVSALANALRAGSVPDRAVAITFDDGFASVATDAAPILARRGFPATVFAVSDYVGSTSDWPTQPATAPRLPLLDARQLRELASLGWEIGSHGRAHAPLATLSSAELHADLAGSRHALEELLDAPVTSFAFPYGSVPAGSRTALADAGYAAGCTTRVGYVTAGSDPLDLPRVDAHYLRHVAGLRRAALGGAGAYLAARRVAARARRVVASDYRLAP